MCNYIQSWCDPCKWTVDKMLTNGLLFLIFVLSSLSRSAEGLTDSREMNWTINPAEAWPYTRNHFELKVVVFLLNKANYKDNGKEYTFIALGVLLDNSRVLTSYNPFKELMNDSEIIDHIVVLLSTGVVKKQLSGSTTHSVPLLQVIKTVCGRQLTDEQIQPDMKNIWRDKKHSPIHDLMIVRLQEELGIANASYRLRPMISQKHHNGGNWNLLGQTDLRFNSIIAHPANITQPMPEPEVLIVTLGYESKKQMLEFDKIHVIEYEEDDVALVDCDEWLPRQWGHFICIRNIGNFPGLGSGAALFSGELLFGIGAFALFKEDVGILVFTDVRPYKELIEKTCGDEEFS